jgi:excisionase family DNA binding protein
VLISSEKKNEDLFMRILTMDSPLPDSLLTTEQACAFLKVSKAALYNYVKSKEIPAFKFGRRWKFQRAALESWIEQKMQESKQAIKQ